MVRAGFARVGGRLFDGASRLLRRPRLRPVVAALTRAHVRLYRLTGGRAVAPGYPTLLLTTTGRRTGALRTVPLVYVRDREAYAVCAAYAGADRHPAWWLNLEADPHGVIEVDGTTRAVVAEPVPDGRREEVWRRLVAMYPPFEAYRGRTARAFPIALLRPVAGGGR